MQQTLRGMHALHDANEKQCLEELHSACVATAVAVNGVAQGRVEPGSPNELRKYRGFQKGGWVVANAYSLLRFFRPAPHRSRPHVRRLAGSGIEAVLRRLMYRKPPHRRHIWHAPPGIRRCAVLGHQSLDGANPFVEVRRQQAVRRPQHGDAVEVASPSRSGDGIHPNSA